MSKPQVYRQQIVLADGRTIEIETGKLAKLANGSVTVRMNDTVLMATVVSSAEAKEGIDFLPLTVDYQEKYSSTGRFPGGFMKRENRLSDYEVLICRLVDRALRPLFPDHFHNEVQVMIWLWSSDKEVQPDCLAGLAASAALSISDIPFEGPISEVRVAKIDGEYIVNPTFQQMANATLDILVSGSIDDINMVEGEMKEVSEAEMLEAIKVAHAAIKDQCQAQLDLRAACGKEKYTFKVPEEDTEMIALVEREFKQKIYEVAKSGADKAKRGEGFKAIIEDFKASLPEDSELNLDSLKKHYKSLQKEVIRDMVLEDRTRLDGRKLDEIRPIWCEVDVLPRVHGSSIFQRGETQALASVTLGTKLDEQLIDGAIIQGTSKFLLHYNFPGFSTGEVRPNRGPGRREVGHGNLALRALRAVLPGMDDNPYTIRITADILESNGSSSMATVCSGCLALLDAGIKLKKPVSGIAMGLISKGGKYAVLSDILGDEDHLGDMDFKITGTVDGITACQMDLKVEGLSYAVLEEALEQAKRGRLHILDKMTEVQSGAREDYKSFVPRIVRFAVAKEYIGAIIGTGGKVIQAIQKETQTVISIEEVGNEGIVEIASPDKEALDKAYNWIKAIVTEPEVGEVYKGKVKTIQTFGAFIEFMPGKEGLLHISEIVHERLANVEDVLSEGDEVEVKLIEHDTKTNKYRLSRKVLLPVPEGMEIRESRPREDRDRNGGGRRDDRGGNRGSGGRGDSRGGGGGRRDDRGGRDNREFRPREDNRPNNGGENRGEGDNRPANGETRPDSYQEPRGGNNEGNPRNDSASDVDKLFDI